MYRFSTTTQIMSDSGKSTFTLKHHPDVLHKLPRPHSHPIFTKVSHTYSIPPSLHTSLNSLSTAYIPPNEPQAHSHNSKPTLPPFSKIHYPHKIAHQYIMSNLDPTTSHSHCQKCHSVPTTENFLNHHFKPRPRRLGRRMPHLPRTLRQRQPRRNETRRTL